MISPTTGPTTSGKNNEESTKTATPTRPSRVPRDVTSEEPHPNERGRRSQPPALFERHLVPPPARRPVVVIVGAAALVVLVLGARYARRGAGELDQRIGAKTLAHLSGHPSLGSTWA